MSAYESLAASYDRLTNDVDYDAMCDFYESVAAREWVTELWQSIFPQQEQPAASEEAPASSEAAEEPASSAAEPEGPADLPESTTEEQEGADA